MRLANVHSPLQYSDHQRAQGRAFFDKACGLSLEGIVSKRADSTVHVRHPDKAKRLGSALQNLAKSTTKKPR